MEGSIRYIFLSNIMSLKMFLKVDCMADIYGQAVHF